ncbi:MAG: hypothetical protein LBJ32_01160 [Oscillospiraceae bacterium]|jgi:beta-N-acetylglucosaminidase|nr:hypothetical protein [Oscillospiraceae bacterium]
MNKLNFGKTIKKIFSRYLPKFFVKENQDKFYGSHIYKRKCTKKKFNKFIEKTVKKINKKLNFFFGEKRYIFKKFFVSSLAFISATFILRNFVSGIAQTAQIVKKSEGKENNYINDNDISVLKAAKTAAKNKLRWRKIAKSYIEMFPEYMKEKLYNLNKKFPDWIFIPVPTGFKLHKTAKAQLGHKSLVENFVDSLLKHKEEEYFFPEKDEYEQYRFFDKKVWVAANFPTVKHFIDPNNYINENEIFAFESLTYDAEIHKKEGIEKILNGTFMYDEIIKYIDKNGEEIVTTEKYSDVILKASKKNNLNPYYFASKIRIEVCRGDGSKSGSVTGNYKEDFIGYYNFLNIGANDGEDPISNALERAKQKGWDSPEKSISDGAEFISSFYINKGQNTAYFQRFNTNSASAFLPNEHQYFTSIYGVCHIHKVSEAYKKLGILSDAKKFLIPIYENDVPRNICKLSDGFKTTGIMVKDTKVYSNPNIDYEISDIDLLVNEEVTILGFFITNSEKLMNYLRIPYWGKIEFFKKGEKHIGYVPYFCVNKNSKIEIKSEEILYITSIIKNSKGAFYESSDHRIVRINKKGEILAKNKGNAIIYIFKHNEMDLINIEVL